jgi:hypothetical protein
MSFIIYPQKDGKIAIIFPADQNSSLQEIAAKDVPAGIPYKIVNGLDVDDDYFNAYEFHAGLGAEVNIEKAKALHLDKFRAARASKLSALDVAYSIADEAGDVAKKAEIAAQKQALRDITKVQLPDNFSDLKLVWPNILN